MEPEGRVRLYKIVVNHEEQYSIWPDNLKLPLGWQALGVSTTKEKCLSEIAERWQDMRPLSIRSRTPADFGKS